MSEETPRPPRRLRRWTTRVLVFPAAVLTVWAGLLEMPGSAAAGVVLCVLLALTGLRGCLFRVVQSLGLLAWLGAAIGLWWLPLVEGDASLDRWQSKLDRGEPLATHQLAGAWGLHATLIPMGFVAGFNEATWEVIALHHGGGPYHWPGDVALREPELRRIVRGWVHTAEASTGPVGPVRYAWPGLYDRPEHSLQAALALNCPLVLTGERGHDADGPFVDVHAACLVTWPTRARIPIGSVAGRPIALQEGVFRGLQDAGWITPVQVVWSTRVRPGDPRLHGNEVRRGWLEDRLSGR